MRGSTSSATAKPSRARIPCEYGRDGILEGVAQTAPVLDGRERTLRLPARQSPEHAEQLRVLAAREQRQEAGVDREQRGDRPAHLQPPFVGYVDAGERAKHGRLAGTAAADQSDALPARSGEGDIADSPVCRRARAEAGRIGSDDATMSVEGKPDPDLLGAYHALKRPWRTAAARRDRTARTAPAARWRSRMGRPAPMPPARGP